MSHTELMSLTATFRAMRTQPPVSIEMRRVGADRMAEHFQPPTGMVFEHESVQLPGSVEVQAIWGLAAQGVEGRTLLYLHGGGFSVGSAQGFRGLAGSLAEQSNSNVLIPDYRLSPENAFPAAVDDASTAYRWLLDQGVPPELIVMVGDSCGANLVLVALLAARDAGLPMPAGAVLISPWVDLTLSGQSVIDKANEDPFLTAEMLGGARERYLKNAAPSHPSASPLFADLNGLPPLLIQVGTAEILLDDAKRLAECAKSADVEVTLDIWPDMFHVWHAFAPQLSEGRDAIAKAARFIDGCFC